MRYKLCKKPKAPKKLYRTKLGRILGIVSPNLYHRYYWDGDEEVIEYARKMEEYFESLK